MGQVHDEVVGVQRAHGGVERAEAGALDGGGRVPYVLSAIFFPAEEPGEGGVRP
ncbi:hypothetical protein [Nonomuraea rubra]|uniref:hypothetical protein n=1 Tax=Nonomuraea rubra TaxID=46180 RepID=UPI0033DA7EB6